MRSVGVCAPPPISHYQASTSSSHSAPRIPTSSRPAIHCWKPSSKLPSTYSCTFYVLCCIVSVLYSVYDQRTPLLSHSFSSSIYPLPSTLCTLSSTNYIRPYTKKPPAKHQPLHNVADPPPATHYDALRDPPYSFRRTVCPLSFTLQPLPSTLYL